MTLLRYCPAATKNFLSSCDAPVTLMRSPAFRVKLPFGMMASPPRSTTPTSTFALKLPTMSLSCIPSSLLSGSMRCSIISALPLEKASTLIALGKRRMRDISFAHSSSGFTMTESPSASRRNSVCFMYPVSRIRAMTCFVPSLRAEIPQTMFISSLRMAAMMRSASAAPASVSVSGFAALPSTHITSRLFERLFITAGLLSITMMSCPSSERMLATE